MNHHGLSSDLLTAKKMIQSSLEFLCYSVLGFKDVNDRTHGDTINALESETKRKLICLPRGSLKSSIACVGFPIWLLCNDPNLRILIDSELYTNSKTFLREIKGHLESDEMKTLFGEWRGELWNESEILIKQRTKRLKEASITVGGIGTVKVGQHYDVIIGDDYNSAANSNTPENAQRVIDHYRYNQSILEPGGIYVIIGTRYSEMDIISFILRNQLGIEGAPKTGEYEVKSVV